MIYDNFPITLLSCKFEWIESYGVKTTLIYTHVTNHSLSKIQSPLDKLIGSQQNLKFLGKSFEKPEGLD